MQEKMHILQLGPYPPPRGGVQTNMFAIQDELVSNGHQSSIMPITKTEKIGDEENVYHSKSPIMFLKFLLTLKRDILHLHIGGNVPRRVQLLILICGLFAKGKSVLTFHSGGYAVSEEGQNASYWSFLGFGFRLFDKIIVVNKLMEEMFDKFGVKANKVELILPYVLSHPKEGVEIPDKFQQFWKKYDKVLVSISLLEDEYDLPLQINALEKVLQKHPNTGLVVLGSGSLKNDLQNLIDSKPYSEHIFLAGDTDRELILHLVKKANVLLRTTKFDGDAISVREGLFLGTPVIATDNGMRPKGVTLIPIRDISALEKAIVQELERKEPFLAVEEDGTKNVRDVVRLYKNILFAGKEINNLAKKKTDVQRENT